MSHRIRPLLLAATGALFVWLPAGKCLAAGATPPRDGLRQHAVARWKATREQILYSFRGGRADGSTPVASLIADKAGALYGTTEFGGRRDSGTIFRLRPSGAAYAEKLLYAFRGGNHDGAYPLAGLLADSSGKLFGTTSQGGSTNCVHQPLYARCGTVFELAPSHGGYAESVIHAFQDGGGDGAYPDAGLIADQSGNLFGTTVAGLVGGVFELTPGSAYTESVIYAFPFVSSGPQYVPFGAFPAAPVIADATGALYGTTEYGGTGTTCEDEIEECGVVFKLTPSPSGYIETVLHIFADGKDGAFPVAGLTMDGNGALYGTTPFGGARGQGIVFKLTPTGSSYNESILYTFRGGSNDGGLPMASLIADSSSGALYGTTSSGGSANRGTIFELTPSGSGYSERVLYSFQGGNDGAVPYAALIADSSGALYGTTSHGGAADAGTVFKLTH
jgi:uncharacterized repeat protein (TIGR03803 family)